MLPTFMRPPDVWLAWFDPDASALESSSDARIVRTTMRRIVSYRRLQLEQPARTCTPHPLTGARAMTRFDEGQGVATYEARGSRMWFKATADTTGGRFSLMERSLPAGGRMPPPHRHTGN